MNRRAFVAAGLLSALLAAGAAAGDANKEAKPELYNFGTLRAMTVENARTQAQDWLTKAGKSDAATRKQFDAIWANADTALLDKVAATLSLDGSVSLFGSVLLTVTETFGASAVLAAASRARAESTCVPSVTPVVFQEIE